MTFRKTTTNRFESYTSNDEVPKFCNSLSDDQPHRQRYLHRLASLVPGSNAFWVTSERADYAGAEFKPGQRNHRAW